MSEIRISTHRLTATYAPVFEAMINMIAAMNDPGQRKLEVANGYLNMGQLIDWNSGDGWQGVLRKIKTKGMDPATDIETGASREGDHGPSEGQGVGAAFIFDRERRILVFYHGIPRSTPATLIKYLHNKTSVDFEAVGYRGIPRRGALEDFRNASDIKSVRIPLDGEEAKRAAAAKQSGFIWRAVEDLPAAVLSAELQVKFDVAKYNEQREQLETALISDLETDNEELIDLRVTYKDSEGKTRKNVDLSSELFVERFVSPSEDTYMLDHKILTLLHANYGLMLEQHQVLVEVPND